MGDYFFIASSISVVLLINLVIVSFPGAVGEVSGLNTTELQSDTNISSTVDVNQTSESNAVNQAGNLANVYTNQNSENRYLAALFLIYTFLIAAWVVDKVWIG